MRVTPLGIDGAWLVEAPTFPDNRGVFREWFLEDLCEKSDLPKFVVKQANTSVSKKGVIRGIHYSSTEDGQSKLVTCTSGSILDVIVDLRHESKNFGKSVSVELSSENGSSVFISSGLGHGFQALEDNVAVTYLLDKKYNPVSEFGVNPLDENLGIKWKSIDVVISEKDRNSQNFLDLKSTGRS